jgi:hypothetical protein
MATHAQPTTQSAKSRVNSPHFNEGTVESEFISHSLTNHNAMHPSGTFPNPTGF